MAARLPWIERKFSFDFDVRLFPDVVERLRGTPARVEEKVRLCPKDRLTRKEGDTWSVLENAGHLIDLEPLWAARLEEFLCGAKELRAADMSNRTTHEAGHNKKDPEKLLAEFRRARGALVKRVEGLKDSDFARTSIHPRLKQPMRLVDLLFFVASHDDYHLARMTELMK